MSAEAGHVAGCFRSLSAGDIRYAVLHGVENIPDHVYSDIDVVVPRGSMAALTKVLADFASGEGGALCQVIRHETTAAYHVLALPDVDGGPAFLKIDASTDFRRDRRLFFTSDELLSDARLVDGIVSVSAGAEFAAYLAKRVLKGSAASEHLARLRNLWMQDEAGCRLYCRLLVADDTLEVVASALQLPDVDAEASLLTLRRALLRGALRHHPWGALICQIGAPFRYIVRMRYKTGFQVALLGPDGVGKSSVLESLAEKLAPAFRRVDSMHLRPALLPARRTGGVNSTMPYRDPVFGPVKSALKLAYLLLDYGLGYWVRVWPRLVSSTLLLCDRYYLDIVADPSRYRYGGPRWLAAASAALVPGPDLYVTLTASPDTVQARKAEVSRDITERQQLGYEHLSRGRRVERIDASNSAEEVFQDVAWLVVRKMSERAVVRA